MGRLKTPPPMVSAAPALVSYAGGGSGAARDRARAASARQSLRHLYHTARWRRLRLWVADRDDWMCRQTGVLLVEGRKDPRALVVDHIKPHKGDLCLFWDPDNLQAVAKEWHDSAKQRLDHAAARGIGAG